MKITRQQVAQIVQDKFSLGVTLITTSTPKGKVELGYSPLKGWAVITTDIYADGSTVINTNFFNDIDDAIEVFNGYTDTYKCILN